MGGDKDRDRQGDWHRVLKMRDSLRSGFTRVFFELAIYSENTSTKVLYYLHRHAVKE